MRRGGCSLRYDIHEELVHFVYIISFDYSCELYARRMHGSSAAAQCEHVLFKLYYGFAALRCTAMMWWYISHKRLKLSKRTSNNSALRSAHIAVAVAVDDA